MASPLAVGAGANEGLDTMLNRMMVQQEVNERARHDQATEALTGRGLDQNEGVRQSLSELRDAQREALTYKQKQDTDSNTAIDAMIADPTVPDATKIGLRVHRALPPADRGTFPYQLITGPKAPVAKDPIFSDVDMADNGVPKHLKNVPVNVEADGSLTINGNKLNPMNVHRVQPINDAIQIIQTPNGYMRVPKAAGSATPVTDTGGAQIQSPLPANMRAAGANSERAGATLDRMEGLLDEADKRGLIGPGAGRVYGDFLASKVGTTGNPENDQLLGALKYDINTIAPQIALALGEGARGASSVQMLSRWEPLFNEHGKMTVKGAIAEARRMLSDNDKIAKKAAGKTGDTAINPSDDFYQQYLNRPKK